MRHRVFLTASADAIGADSRPTASGAEPRASHPVSAISIA